MRRSVPTLTAALLALSTAPALAADAAEASAVASVEPIALERVEALEAGIAMSFPASWNVRTPLASRQSEIQTGPDEEPAYVIRIDSFDQAQGRVWAMYLLDVPADESGGVDRFLLTCVADADSEPYREAVAESVEPLPAVVEEPAA